MLARDATVLVNCSTQWSKQSDLKLTKAVVCTSHPIAIDLGDVFFHIHPSARVSVHRRGAIPEDWQNNMHAQCNEIMGGHGLEAEEWHPYIVHVRVCTSLLLMIKFGTYGTI